MINRIITSKRSWMALTGILIVIILFWSWLQHPLPKYEGKIELEGLTSSVDVFFAEWAVPHVFAQNEDDLFYVWNAIIKEKIVVVDGEFESSKQK